MLACASWAAGPEKQEARLQGGRHQKASPAEVNRLCSPSENQKTRFNTKLMKELNASRYLVLAGTATASWGRCLACAMTGRGLGPEAVIPIVEVEPVILNSSAPSWLRAAVLS